MPKQILSLTETAAARVRALMAARSEPNATLRIGVKTGGCSGLEYTMEFVAEKKKFDEVVEDKGVTVLVDRPGDAGARARAGVSPESAAILVADRFGEIWHGYDFGEGHAFPDMRELEAWLRYLGTMCPE